MNTIKTIYDIETEEEYLNLKENIDINWERNTLGYNCLFSAEADKAKWLIKHNIKINHKDSQGQTALFGSNLEKTKVLVKAGIDIFSVDNKGYNALFYVNHDLLVLLEREYMSLPDIMESQDKEDIESAKKIIKNNVKILVFLLKSGLNKTIEAINNNNEMGIALIKHANSPEELQVLINHGFIIPENYDINSEKRRHIREFVVCYLLEIEKQNLQEKVSTHDIAANKNRL